MVARARLRAMAWIRAGSSIGMRSQQRPPEVSAQRTFVKVYVPFFNLIKVVVL